MMNIIGCGTVTKLSNLEPGELCGFWGRGEVALAICLEQADRYTKIGLLVSREMAGKTANPEANRDCYSYGKSWVIDVSMSGIKAPSSLKNGVEPRLFLDSDGLKMAFISQQFDDLYFFDLTTHELAERWPGTAVEFDAFKIWQDEAAMTRKDSLPLFTKQPLEPHTPAE